MEEFKNLAAQFVTALILALLFIIAMTAGGL